MKDKKTSTLENELNIEETLKQFSHGHSKLLYWIVLGCLLFLQIVNIFAVSNITELIAAAVSTILLFVLLKIKGKLWKWVSGLYVIILMICLVTTAFTHIPFFGMFSSKNFNSEKYYAYFAEGLYELSIGNYDESLSKFKKIKRIVPEDELVDYYMWYMNASVWANRPDLCTKLSQELQGTILEPNEYEREILFQAIPLINLINILNKEDYDQLIKELKPYMKTNEQIFLLLDLIAMNQMGDILSQDDIILNLEAIQQGVDSFENYDYIKRSLWNILFLDFFAAEKYDCVLIALAELYSIDPAKFFEDYIWEHPLNDNPLNVRWISLDRLAKMKNLFYLGINQLKQSEYELNWETKEKIKNFGLFLGVPIVAAEELDKAGLYSILSDYTENAQIYNIVEVSDKIYLFTILEDEFLSEGKTGFPGMATRADFYLADTSEGLEVRPLYMNGEPLQVDVAMDKLVIVQDTGTAQKFLLTQISGTGEYLHLFVLDLAKETITFLPLDKMYYHTGNFLYNPNLQTCSWSFQIDNSRDPNMKDKVGGTAIAQLDFEKNNMEVETFYVDPSLQLYVNERNEQLIFPLATLNRLGGKEIKDQEFLRLIRNDSKPYYNYSVIQYTYGYMGEFYASDISGITITYSDEESVNGEEQNYFFLTKRVGEEIKLLGIYNVIDSKLKSVY